MSEPHEYQIVQQNGVSWFFRSEESLKSLAFDLGEKSFLHITDISGTKVIIQTSTVLYVAETSPCSSGRVRYSLGEYK